MRTPNGLFFAPGIRFKDLDLEDAHVFADALAVRADHWFFEPATSITQSSPFAAGIIVVCFVDAAAEFTGTTFVQWLQESVPSTAERDPRHTKKSVAESFEEDVRHGLVHHARLNRGAEFSLELEQPIAVIGSVLVVNPRELLSAIRVKWQAFLDRVRSDEGVHQSTARRVARVFKADFQADSDWKH